VDVRYRATKQLEDLDNERKSLTRQNKEKDAKLHGLDFYTDYSRVFVVQSCGMQVVLVTQFSCAFCQI